MKSKAEDGGVYLVGFILLLLTSSLAAFPTRSVPLDDRPALNLRATGNLDRAAVSEGSALVRSSRDPRLFWTVSDSSGTPRIVPIRSTGLLAQVGSLGVTVTGATNLDWEALAHDDAGNLFIGDVGNNLSRRRELHIYRFPEPQPNSPATLPARRLIFTWPDQTQYPDPEQRHDCEAMFWYQGRLHLLTKHRRDTSTHIWRAEIPDVGERIFLTQLGIFDIRGMVTDAAVSPNRKRLAVLTYRMLWVFDLSAKPDNPLAGPAVARALAPAAGQWQLEGCTWLDDRTLLLSSEEGGLFQVPLDQVER